MSPDVLADCSLAQQAGEERRTFLSAEWRYLVMLNYDVPAEALLPLVPAGTMLDLWEGRALVSVVGFRFLRTRVLGMALPLHRNFDEVNLRFYVRRISEAGEVRRGVSFVKEIVPRRGIAVTARWFYNEPYCSLPMRSCAPAGESAVPGRVEYAWRTGAGWGMVGATAAGEAAFVEEGSEGRFITEHYWGYTRQRDGGTVEYEVRHPPWRVWRAEKPTLSEPACLFYGRCGPFEAALRAGPSSAFLAEGSPVTVYRPRRLGGACDRETGKLRA